MLAKGNTKLGRGIYSWSIPAKKTCPGASPICKSLCYATRGHYFAPNVQASLRRNLTRAESDRFVARVTNDVRDNFIRVVRIHAAGDFYSRAYVERWISIARRCPETTFYAYTRSWDVPGLVKVLRRFSRLPNAKLWLSYDRDMPLPPRWKGCSICYLSVDDNDLPRAKVDIVFRDKRKTVIKKTPNGSLVCPFDNGVTDTTCSKCRVCFVDKLIPLQPVYDQKRQTVRLS